MSNRRTDMERGVSPIIGVTLTVAITVVLSAVIGAFVLDFGQRAEKAAPSAGLTVSADTDAGNLTISHTGGDELFASQTQVIVSNSTTDVTFSTVSDDQGIILTVGGEARIDLSDADNGVDWDGDGTYDMEPTSGTHPFDGVYPGERYTVLVIDTEHERVIYETTIAA